MKLSKSLKLFILPLLALFLIACSPDYPKCNNDSDCASSEKGKAEGKLMCVNGLCQQCKQDTDCAGEGMTCNAGICERRAGYCTSDADCFNNQKCRNNTCGAECLGPNDCSDGQECKGGQCVTTVECTLKADCQGGFDCVGGKCVDPSVGQVACQLQTIYFDYDSSILSSEVQSDLQQAATCMKSKGIRVRVEGHADERGTSEYNLALGERRARNAYNYLVQMGVTPSNLSTISYGEEQLAEYCGEEAPDSCHRKNRRVVFDIR